MRWSDGEKQCRHWPALPLTQFLTLSLLRLQVSRIVDSQASYLLWSRGAVVVCETPESGDVGGSGSKLEASATIYVAVSGH